MKLRTLAVIAAVAIAGFAGCAKKPVPVVEPPKPVEKPIVQKPVEKPPVVEPEVFKEVVDPDAEFRRKCAEYLRVVYFDYDKFDVRSDFTDQLGRAASFVMEERTMRILLEGHADERGTDDYNMGLGENRSRAVKEWLVNYGVPASRIEITSWGKTRPAQTCGDNIDDACHSMNRRVEFKVIGR